MLRIWFKIWRLLRRSWDDHLSLSKIPSFKNFHLDKAVKAILKTWNNIWKRKSIMLNVPVGIHFRFERYFVAIFNSDQPMTLIAVRLKPHHTERSLQRHLKWNCTFPVSLTSVIMIVEHSMHQQGYCELCHFLTLLITPDWPLLIKLGCLIKISIKKMTYPICLLLALR